MCHIPDAGRPGAGWRGTRRSTAPDDRCQHDERLLERRWISPSMRIMPRTDAERQPQLRVSDPTETADRRVAVRLGSPLVVEIRGEIDIQSAAELRDELLRVIRRCGPELALDLAGGTVLDCGG